MALHELPEITPRPWDSVGPKLREAENGAATEQKAAVLCGHDSCRRLLVVAGRGKPSHGRELVQHHQEEMTAPLGRVAFEAFGQPSPDLVEHQPDQRLVLHVTQRVLETPPRIGEEGRDPRQGLLRLGVEDMVNHADQQRMAGLLPIGAAFERAFRIEQRVVAVRARIGRIEQVGNERTARTSPRSIASHRP